MSIIAWAPARASARPLRRRGTGSSWRASEALGRLAGTAEAQLGPLQQQQAGGGAAELAGQHQRVAGHGAAARHQQLRRGGVADDRDRECQHRCPGDVASGERGPGLGGDGQAMPSSSARELGLVEVGGTPTAT